MEEYIMRKGLRGVVFILDVYKKNGLWSIFISEEGLAG